MSSLPDPHNAMISFQEGLAEGVLPLQVGHVDKAVSVMMDEPNGHRRLTYARIEAGQVVAFASAIACDPVNGVPCFNIGYAVPAGLRRAGRATAIVEAAIEEMKAGFGRAGIKQFYVEAIVSVDNAASIRVAEKALSPVQSTGEDDFNGGQVHQFLRLVAT